MRARIQRALVLGGVLTAAVAMSAPPQPPSPSHPIAAVPAHRPVPPSGSQPAATANPLRGHPVLRLPVQGNVTRPPVKTAVPAGHTPRRSVSVSVRVIRDPRINPETTPTIAFSLSQNYPNPFRGSTTIRYALARACVCRIAVYSVGGQRVATLVDGPAGAGEYSLQWNGASENGGRVRPGLYFYRIAAGSFMITRKLIIS